MSVSIMLFVAQVFLANQSVQGALLCHAPLASRGGRCQLFRLVVPGGRLILFTHVRYDFVVEIDQFQISPAASPGILHHTLWRIGFSAFLLRWEIIISPILALQLYISKKVGRMYFLNLEVKGLSSVTAGTSCSLCRLILIFTWKESGENRKRYNFNHDMNIWRFTMRNVDETEQKYHNILLRGHVSNHLL